MTDGPLISWGNHPEKGDWEGMADIQWGPQCWDFDQTGVFRHKQTGKFYFADDSGCSCPSPFESTQVEDLKEIGLQDFINHCNERMALLEKSSHYSETEKATTKAEMAEVILKVRDWIRTTDDEEVKS